MTKIPKTPTPTAIPRPKLHLNPFAQAELSKVCPLGAGTVVSAAVVVCGAGASSTCVVVCGASDEAGVVDVDLICRDVVSGEEGRSGVGEGFGFGFEEEGRADEWVGFFEERGVEWVVVAED